MFHKTQEFRDEIQDFFGKGALHIFLAYILSGFSKYQELCCFNLFHPDFLIFGLNLKFSFNEDGSSVGDF